jgi:hypothetical protein
MRWACGRQAAAQDRAQWWRQAMEADPQAAVLLALVRNSAVGDVEDIQTAMSVYVALLLEVGSGFGMYIAFSQWRLYDREAPAAPAMSAIMTVTEPAVVSQPVAAPMIAAAKTPRVTSANDNVNKASAKLVAPETDVERFYRKVDAQDGFQICCHGFV